MSNPKNRGIGYHRVDRYFGRPWASWKFDKRVWEKPPKKMVLKTAKRFHNCKEKKWLARKSKS